MIESSFTLPDGRELSYAEYLSPTGYPVIYSHGFCGSRIEGRLIESCLQHTPEVASVAQRCRLIVPERPGHGRSTPRPGMTLVDWPTDLTQLANSLGLDRFSMLGVACGGSYALAAASTQADRVAGVAVLAGLGPMEREGAREGMSPTLQVALELAVANPEMLGPMIAMTVGEPGEWRHHQEEAFFDRRPDIWDILVESGREAIRHGTDGVAQDMRVVASRWTFDLTAVRAPVQIWHGAKDHLIPVHHARRLAADIPSARLHELPDEDHVSLYAKLPAALVDLLEQVGA